MEHRSLIWELADGRSGRWHIQSGEKLSSDTVTCGRRTGLLIVKCTHCVQVYNCWIGIACKGFITSGWATTPRRAVKHYPSPQVTQIDCYQPARTTSSSSLSMRWFGRMCHWVKLIVIRCGLHLRHLCSGSWFKTDFCTGEPWNIIFTTCDSQLCCAGLEWVIWYGLPYYKPACSQNLGSNGAWKQFLLSLNEQPANWQSGFRCSSVYQSVRLVFCSIRKVKHAIQQSLPTSGIICLKHFRWSICYKWLSLTALLNHLPPQVGDGGSDGVDFNEERNTGGSQFYILTRLGWAAILYYQ